MFVKFSSLQIKNKDGRQSTEMKLHAVWAATFSKLIHFLFPPDLSSLLLSWQERCSEVDREFYMWCHQHQVKKTSLLECPSPTAHLSVPHSQSESRTASVLWECVCACEGVRVCECVRVLVFKLFHEKHFVATLTEVSVEGTPSLVQLVDVLTVEALPLTVMWLKLFPPPLQTL